MDVAASFLTPSVYHGSLQFQGSVSQEREQSLSSRSQIAVATRAIWPHSRRGQMPDLLLQVAQLYPWVAFAVIVVVVVTVAWLVIGQGRSFKVWPPEIGEQPKREVPPHKAAPVAVPPTLSSADAPPSSHSPAPDGHKRKTADDYYPRIESVSDNYGFVREKSDRTPLMHTRTHHLSVGDVLTVTVIASDPQGDELQFSCRFRPYGSGSDLQREEWVDYNTFVFRCTEACLGGIFVDIHVRNATYPTVTDSASLIYHVIPKQRRTAA
jgi:hypothetical protein